MQFVCLKYGRSIIISWRDQFASPPKSQIRRYQLAVDFQTISNVMEMESVEHYVSELHDVNGKFIPIFNEFLKKYSILEWKIR